MEEAVPLPQLTTKTRDHVAHARRKHPNALLTPKGRRRIVELRVEQDWTSEATAEQFQDEAKTVRKWRDRFLAEG